MSPSLGAAAPSDAGKVGPAAFAIVMTVRNARPWIEEAIGSLLPQLGPDGEIVVVDSASDDGTTDYLRSVAARARLRLVVEPCTMGRGRDRGIRETAAGIVLTQVDGDVRYPDGVVRQVVGALGAHPEWGLLWVMGRNDLNPDGEKVFGWRREFYLATEGYPDSNVGDDVGAVRNALRRGKVGRLLVDQVGVDLRHAGRDPNAVHDPWKKGPGFLRVSRRRYSQGWTWRLYLRFLWVTRRTFPRFVAGAAVASLARITPAE